MTELMNPPTITPDSTSMMVESRRMSRGMSVVRNTARHPPTKANSCRDANPSPSRIETAAPTQAPFDTPSKSGETSGFLKMPWYTAPASARAEPTSSAASTRGRRNLSTTFTVLSE